MGTVWGVVVVEESRGSDWGLGMGEERQRDERKRRRRKR